MFLGAIVIIVVGVLTINYFRSLDTGDTIPALETETQEENITLPTKHIVEEGEDLWKISEKYYGTGYNWVDIAEANNLSVPSTIKTGQELTIPDVTTRTLGDELAENTTQEAQSTETPAQSEMESIQETVESPTVTPAQEEQNEQVSQMADQNQTVSNVENKIEGDTYTVVKGDNLWNIAQRAYGNPYRWVEIASANHLLNPNLIHPGNEFVIPR